MAAVPATLHYAVYALHRLHDAAVYIGSTSNLRRRLQQHAARGPLSRGNKFYKQFTLEVLHGQHKAIDENQALDLEKIETVKARQAGFKLINSSRIQGKPTGHIAYHMFRVAKNNARKYRLRN
jgi:predicted GIY-YIG superfamily endonuclease